MSAEASAQEDSVEVEITIRLKVTAADNAATVQAIANLADVMLVQAEDGLWSLGHAEAENDDGPSEYLGSIEHLDPPVLIKRAYS